MILTRNIFLVNATVPHTCPEGNLTASSHYSNMGALFWVINKYTKYQVVNTLWLRKQGVGENLIPEAGKKTLELKNTEFVVLAENTLSLVVL